MNGNGEGQVKEPRRLPYYVSRYIQTKYELEPGETMYYF